ncbi:conserved hypothetical protein [Culex quinquefasciatus]|uniref:SSD domain-containing protein n=1 Tax=Culex quinquefasciatus TaxID=7176 RepID=B0W7A3_CULQU|nr:conserved hypothetical protein [Culex quinquefasciatus]|eukprot:XP_001844587.1 conserved hypothetical protein [Culex quinquefasciatus]
MPSGIGIDDTFVMLAAWRRTSVKLSVPERMGHMMSEAAVSITITSLTDMLSFWIGIACPFPSVQIFCTYSGLAVCFTYLWHVTFFAACMAVSGHCEFKNLHAIFGYRVLPESVAIKAIEQFNACQAGLFTYIYELSKRKSLFTILIKLRRGHQPGPGVVAPEGALIQLNACNHQRRQNLKTGLFISEWGFELPFNGLHR